MHARLAQGPRLVHAVLRVEGDPATSLGELRALRERLAQAGHDPGRALQAARDIPTGRLAWHITVRDDGALLAGGVLPTLIAWEGAHPCDTLPAAPLQLRHLSLHGLPEAVVQALRTAGLPPGLQGVDSATGPPAPALTAVIDGPRGTVTLTSGEPA
jgi:hypothetical protein